MIMRRFDRYVLREMIGPFLVSVGGLFLFILLNLILSLSGLMVDRGVGIPAMLRLLVLKTPTMLVLALPVSGLFATFLGLGRLVHDREIMALETSGISLRRILLPLVIAAFILGLGDFALYNWAVPPAERAYQISLRRIIFREGTPHIRANTFFKGPQGEFFYVRRYDEKDKSLHDVLVYDTQGKLFPEAKAAVTILTAKKGRWENETWDLTDGRVYGYDSDGVLIYNGKFDNLKITTGSEGIGSLFSSRTPAEMGIGELRQRIEMLKKSGLSADELIVECHLKAAIPLAAVVFVLFGGATSLLFAWRSRAVGIVIGFLLVGLFQGTLLWTQTLGKRGIISPAISAWIPDLVFGLVGLLLFLRLDRLHSGDWQRWFKLILPFLAIILLGIGAFGEELPVSISCDKLFISSDKTHVEATGAVRLTYEKTDLSADRVRLDKDEDGTWRLSAQGSVSIKVGDDFELAGDEISAVLTPQGDGLATAAASARDFQGKSGFTNSKGEAHLLLYRGKEGKIAFAESGEVESIEINEGKLSTCDCCGGILEAQPYSIKTGTLILYPNRLIVAFNISVYSFGIPVFWLPIYVQPLQETMESPLFPAFGRSALHGYFLKWNIPFYIDRENYGAILFDYFNRFHEIGLGAVLHYAFAGLSGRARLYFFPARVGEPVTEISLVPTIELPGGGTATGSVSYRKLGDKTDLTYSFSLDRSLKDWTFRLSASRKETKTETAKRTVECLPEISLSRSGIPAGPFSLTAGLSAGWFKEWDEEAPAAASLRADGTLTAELPEPISLATFEVSPRVGIEITRYESVNGSEERTSAFLSTTLSAPGMSLSYTYRLVQGKSPFTFDRIETTNHLALSLGGEGEPSVSIRSGFDFTEPAFDPVIVNLGWPPFSLVLDYELNSAQLKKVTLSGVWKGSEAAASFRIPYSPADERFGKATFSLKTGHARDKLSLSGAFSAETGLNLTFAAELGTEAGWGLTLSGRYKSGVDTILNPGIGVFYEFYRCLRVGVEQETGQIWLYVSITAFPKAVLRYAPTGAGVAVGSQ